ncbi:MAG: hypothetical protein V3U24_00295 [Candidatus Neomarinimicrobiota bacterium]
MKFLFSALIPWLLLVLTPAVGSQPNLDETGTGENLGSLRGRYLTDEEGNILMYVNVWGHVTQPGHHLVFEGIELSTLLSVTGGPKGGANLGNIRLFREFPDEGGKLAYTIDFEKFLKTGDRTGFVRILPNDTYIIPEKGSSIMFRQVGTFSVLLGIINLYYQVLNYQR